MILDFGTLDFGTLDSGTSDFGASASGLRTVVEDSHNATVMVPAGFPAGEYELRLNFQETGQMLTVLQPTWTTLQPGSIKFGRQQKDLS